MLTRDLHPDELIRRAEHLVTVAFLATAAGERGELDRHELDALNTVLGEGMRMLRRANELLDEQDDAAAGSTETDRMVPRP
jgi:hypothetical protein